MLAALLLTAFAIGGVSAGVLLGRTRGLPPRIAAASGGLLFGISLFWMLPEMVRNSGWLVGLLALCVGVAVLWCIDHFVHPICPSCSHSHNHEHCTEPPLHGFAGPLLIATGLHSVLDGWSIQMVAGSGFASLALPVGLALHKVPEGLALGLVARESIDSIRKAFWACVAAESLTLLGAWIEPQADRAGAIHFGALWVTGVLAIVGGSFIFLGFHAVDGSRRKPGVIPTFVLTLLAVAVLALVQRHSRGI
jgi:zinc transporter ZupT